MRIGSASGHQIQQLGRHRQHQLCHDDRQRYSVAYTADVARKCLQLCTYGLPSLHATVNLLMKITYDALHFRH